MEHTKTVDIHSVTACHLFIRSYILYPMNLMNNILQYFPSDCILQENLQYCLDPPGLQDHDARQYLRNKDDVTLCGGKG